MVALVVSSIAWTYVAQLTGSVIPSMTAHALTNLFATVVIFYVWIPFAIVAAFVVWQRQPILRTLRQFADEWRDRKAAAGLWFGVFALLLFLALLLFAMSQLGRMTGLVVFGVVALAITVVNIGIEKRCRPTQ